jgi:hypothetical protein
VPSQVHTRIRARLMNLCPTKPRPDMLQCDDRVVVRGLKNESRMGGRGLEECE